MPTYYFSDSDLTDRLADLTLTGTKLDTSAKRDAAVRAPASAVVDGWFPGISPFAADPSTPDLVAAGALEVGLWFAYRILSGESDDKQAAVSLEAAEKIFQVKDGRAGVAIPGVDDGTGFEVVDVTRSVLDEDRDEKTNREALHP